MKFEAILCDLDGTFSIPRRSRRFREPALAEQGVPERDRVTINISSATVSAISAAAHRYGSDIEASPELVEKFVKLMGRYSTDVAREDEAVPGVPEMLDGLRSRVKLGVLSNKLTIVQGRSAKLLRAGSRSVFGARDGVAI
jgi:phosphoglycolate phosphatase-like HAD superfamily hydrolase